MDTLKELSFGPLQLGGGVIVAHLRGQRIELIKGHSLLEILRSQGQGFEFLIRRHHVLVTVTLSLFTFLIEEGFGEETGTMEIQIRDQMVLVEGVDESGVVLRNVGVAEVFAHGGGVFTLYQGIVVWRERDLVNSMSSLLRSVATW